MILQKLVGNIYSVFMEILLWLVPIAGMAAGIIVSGMFVSESAFVVLLGLLGLLVGFLLDIILLGPVIILLNMRSSLKNIENK